LEQLAIRIWLLKDYYKEVVKLDNYPVVEFYYLSVTLEVAMSISQLPRFSRAGLPLLISS